MNWKSQRSLRCPPFRQVGPNLCFRYQVTAKCSAATAGDNLSPKTATLSPKSTTTNCRRFRRLCCLVWTGTHARVRTHAQTEWFYSLDKYHNNNIVWPNTPFIFWCAINAARTETTVTKMCYITTRRHNKSQLVRTKYSTLLSYLADAMEQCSTSSTCIRHARK